MREVTYDLSLMNGNGELRRVGVNLSTRANGARVALRGWNVFVRRRDARSIKGALATSVGAIALTELLYGFDMAVIASVTGDLTQVNQLSFGMEGDMSKAK